MKLTLTLLAIPFQIFRVWRRKPFKRALCRAYSDGVINSYQMHELAARFDQLPKLDRKKPEGGYPTPLSIARMTGLCIAALSLTLCASAQTNAPVATNTDVITDIENAFKDTQSFFGSNTVLTIDAGVLYADKQWGALLDFHTPLPLGTNGQVAVGMSFAYLDHQFYSATLDLKAGTTVPLWVLGDWYLWAETGPTLNLHDHSVGSQTFTGLTKGLDIYRGFWLYFSGGVGNISFLPGAAYLGAVSGTF